ncbi:DUF7344 domain-containing protein [Salarchaeum japonicum]|uniref:DUF7344 domain-containing protein n=1 Tax=Salarchaeum japonicum TaxID=555573 RepID=UPI003C75DCE9
MSSEATGGSSTQGELTEDALFSVLSNRRRRYAVHALKREKSAVELGDLAEQVAAWEYDTPISEVSYEERKRVYTALQQSHLPMMDDANVVDFDKRRGVVEPTPALADADVYMEVVQGREIPWSQYYLGLSGVALALTLAVAVNAWPFTFLSNFAWLVATAVAFTVSAAIHTVYANGLRIGETERPPELENK